MVVRPCFFSLNLNNIDNNMMMVIKKSTTTTWTNHYADPWSTSLILDKLIFNTFFIHSFIHSMYDRICIVNVCLNTKRARKPYGQNNQPSSSVQKFFLFLMLTQTTAAAGLDKRKNEERKNLVNSRYIDNIDPVSNCEKKQRYSTLFDKIPIIIINNNNNILVRFGYFFHLYIFFNVFFVWWWWWWSIIIWMLLMIYRHSFIHSFIENQ